MDGVNDTKNCLPELPLPFNALYICPTLQIPVGTYIEEISSTKNSVHFELICIVSHGKRFSCHAEV